ncbi:protein turtle homolog B isoform X4 [Anguilla anguilla]|uniref:protein turtle homolog B isoform X4 n=1 Tax=Anguilla anguilla TaxID=7936 RepID=UPI0015A9B785|nr:protein turtle homolog B isoform X4 [Anguilla anguilla]
MIWYVATLIASVVSTRGTAAQGAHGNREEPQFVTARAGESVILGCDVAHPLNGQPYVVEWFKFGVPIPFFINFRFYPPHVDPEYAGRASLYGKSSLRIEQVRSDDQGWYECKVLMLEQQYDTFHNGSWVHLTVNAPPTFTDTPPQYVEAKEGGSITLSCTAFGNPKPVVSWLREGELLGNSRKYKVSDGSLTVMSISREDRGAYTCRAYSVQGEAVHTTRLLVQGPPFIVSPPENITVNISQDAFFTCQAEAYPGNLTYTWFWEEDNVYFKNDLKRRVRILVDGSLIISQVKPEDAGKYTCSPSNSLGRPPSASAYLTVQYPARVVNMPPVIYVAIGLPGFIRCPVDANPPVTMVKWRKDGLPLRVEKYPGWSQMEDGSIRVAEVTEDSLGTYTCVPYNALGTMGQSPPAPLVLKDPPKFSVVPGGEYRQEAGRELVIPCEAEGDPFPNITWRKVGKPSRSKHNVLPRGSLQFKSLSKEDHGEWECVATNVATSITASTHLLVIGTSPHPPTNVHVSASTTLANVSWEPGYDGGYEQTFSVWYGHVVKRAQLGPHDWLSTPVTGTQNWLLVQGLEPETAYQFSVLAQNKLGTGPFSEVVTVNTLVFPISTPEPLVLLTPPRCLTANRTQQGVLLTWIPPANHTSPIDRYIMEFRLGERWDVLDDAIAAGETELLARDLVQDSWYEFRVMAVMEDLTSEPSNVVGVSSTDFFPPPDIVDEGLARPVVAGIVATICFLAAAILFSTLAACFVNKQRRRKLKRRRDPPLSITHCRKSVETPTPLTPLPGIEPYWEGPEGSSYRPPPASPQSSGKVSPESIRSLGPPSESSEDGRGPPAKKVPQSPGKEKELSLYKKTKRAIISKKYSVSKHEAEATTPIELISRGPDGRFVMDPSEMETSVKLRRIEGFPFVEESDLYPEFRQSDEENDDPGPMPPVMATLRPQQISPISSSQESYMQPPAYSPRFHRPMEGMTIMESSRLQATGQIRAPPHHRIYTHSQYYGYLGSPGDPDPLPPFYMPETSPLSSVMSSPPYLPIEGPFGHPTIPEEMGEGEIQHYASSGSTLPLTHVPSSHSPDIWQHPDFSFSGLEGPHFILPPHHPLYLHRDPTMPPPHFFPPSSLQPSSLQVTSYPGILPLEAPKSRPGKSPSKVKPQGPPAKRLTMQGAQSLGQLRHTSHGMGVPVLPYPDPAAYIGSPSTLGSLDTRWYDPGPRLSPRAPRRMEPSMHQVVLQPSRLSPLTQSPLSSHEGSPEIVVRPRPRPGIVQPSIPPELSEITLQPPAAASFSRRSSPSSSPAQGQGSRRASPSYRSHMAFATTATSYPSQSPSPPMESSDVFGQMPSQRRTDEEMLPSEPSPPQLSASGKRLGASSATAGSERMDALRYQRIKKAKKVVINNNNSKSRRKTGVAPSQTQQLHASQVLQPEEALYLRKKKKRPARQDPYARFSALLYRRPPREDQKAILASMDTGDPDHATLL